MEHIKTQYRGRFSIRQKVKFAPVAAASVLERIAGNLMNSYERVFVSPETIAVDFYKEEGFAWFRKGDFVKTRDFFFMYIERAGSEDRDTGVLYMLAMCYKNMDEDSEAVAFLKRAEKTAKNDPEIISALGECLYNIEDYPEAVVFLLKAARISPWDSGIQYRLGICHEKMQRPEEAEEFYKKAIALDPDKIEYHQTLGFLYKAEDRHKDAIAVLRKALDAELRRKRTSR
ncbi:MAG: tetratricopeptide repeat protein [Candidatus Omnitrophica bacterium]|nr:tetratricopeptide repeat protein [Candidatus Omnitrophota bacterium]